MPHKSHLILLATSVLATSAWAQSAPQPLNLTLPRDSVSSQTDASTAPARSAKATSTAAVSAPAVPATVPATATVQPPSANSPPPDAQYNETANQIVDAADSANRPVDVADSGKPACDDATYAQPQVHGSVGMGVVGGNHISGNYQTGSVQVRKNLGSCDHPTGGVSLSIDVGRGNFNGSRGRH
jgi:hypothetical protein